MKSDDIVSAIMNSPLSAEDIDDLIDTIKTKRSQLAKSNVERVSVGAQVSWKLPQNGTVMTGKVLKAGYRNLTVRVTGAGMWMVPASIVTNVA